jgi:hypothetical protein
VDSPRVTVERMEGGSWVPLTSKTGRLITEADHDILLGHTPFPLNPSDAVQEHRYWAAWQAVGHVHHKRDLPEGTYRLKVTGQRFVGTETTWPFTTEPYEVVSEAFELVQAELAVWVDAKEGLTVSLPGPEYGWRLVDVDGAADGDHPVREPVEVSVEYVDGSSTVYSDVVPVVAGAVSRLDVDLTDAVRVEVVDGYGNGGSVEL